MTEAETLERVARLTGETAAQLERWVALGLLPFADGVLSPDAIERVRLIRFALARGTTAEAIALSSDRLGDVLGRYVELLVSEEPRVSRPMDQVAAAVGLEEEFFQRVWAATGIRDQLGAYDEDVEALRALAMASLAGIPEDALLQIVRVLADSTSRIAETLNRVFHFYVHERLRREGLSGAELTETTEALGQPLMGLVEPAVLYFHRKAWERAVRDDLLVHLAEDVTPPGDTTGEMFIALLFVDLAGFTALTEVMGDAAAARVLDRFSDLVRHAANANNGRIVKQIGDEFMLVFPAGRDALRCGLDICRHARTEHDFPDVRLGAHAGAVLYREGDYTGATVNLTARVAGHARAGQFLVTDVMRPQDELREINASSIGAHRLKGVAEPIELFEVAAADDESRAWATDPVCGMRLDPRRAESRLSWRGRELFFCSEQCLQRFIAKPAQYDTATAAFSDAGSRSTPQHGD